MRSSIKNRKILLIEPPFYRLFKDTYALVRYPLSLGYLATALRRDSDWEVMVYNSDFSRRWEPFQVTYFTGAGFREYRNRLKDIRAGIWGEIQSVIARFSPSIVGVTAKSSTFASALNVARLAKETVPRAIVIAGGPHVSSNFLSVLAHPEIDIGVIGEGEDTIVELAQTLANRRPLSSVRGIAYRKGNKVTATPPRSPIKNLDRIGHPHEFAPQVLKDYDAYPPVALGRVLATRGCPFNCLFCGSRAIWGRGVRFRKPENVADELMALQAGGVDSIHFEDDTFGVNPRYLKSLTRTIGSAATGLGWSCETHVSLVSKEHVAMMKQAGCHTIQLGIESGSNRILEAMRKGFDIGRALDACEVIKSSGLKLEAFFMAGFPNETESTLRDTLMAIKKIPADKIIYSLFTPYPGTEAFELCRSKGLIDPDYDPSLYHHQSPLNCFCSDLAPDRFRALAAEIERMVVEKNGSAGEREKE